MPLTLAGTVRSLACSQCSWYGGREREGSMQGRKAVVSPELIKSIGFTLTIREKVSCVTPPLSTARRRPGPPDGCLPRPLRAREKRRAFLRSSTQHLLPKASIPRGRGNRDGRVVGCGEEEEEDEEDRVSHASEHTRGASSIHLLAWWGPPSHMPAPLPPPGERGAAAPIPTKDAFFRPTDPFFRTNYEGKN